MGLPEFHITSYYFKKPLGSVYFIYLKNQFLKSSSAYQCLQVLWNRFLHFKMLYPFASSIRSYSCPEISPAWKRLTTIKQNQY